MGGSRDVQGILQTAWRSVSEETSREDPGISKGPSGQHGGLCLRDTVGGSRDGQGILRTAWWGPVSEGTPWEDPGMAKGSSGQHGGLCLRETPRGCPRESVSEGTPREDPGMSKGSFGQHALEIASFPGLPHFSSSVCNQYNTRKRKSAKKRGRPGLIHHVSDVRWTRGGRDNDIRGRGPTAHSSKNRYEWVLIHATWPVQ